MEYLLFAVLMALVLTGWLSRRHRTTSDARKSVESFRRAMDALQPETKGKAKRR